MAKPILGSIAITANIFHDQMEMVFGKDDNPIAESSCAFVRSLFERFKSRDPVEQMLFSSMILTMGRLAILSGAVHKQESVRSAQMMHTAADAAANTIRRTTLALMECRRPPRSSSFTAVAQANLAAQQVVQNGIGENAKATNGLGSSVPQALPAHGEGLGILAALCPTAEAMAVEHRPQDGAGKAAVKDERAKARRAVRRDHGPAAGGRGTVPPASRDGSRGR